METALLAANDFGVPLPMILAVIRTESDFDPYAISRVGACGLMQLMPETFRYLRDDVFGDSLTDRDIFLPAVNIRYGTYYLSYLYRRFGDWYTALAAYNAGEGRVSNWLTDVTLSPNGRLRSIPFPETAAYVQNTLKAYKTYSKNLEKEYRP